MARAVTSRRALWIAEALALILVSASIVACAWLAESSLRNTAAASGWSLFALLVASSAYNAKKRLSVFPAGRSTHWFRSHVYGGVLSGVLFFVHTGPNAVRGSLEIALGALFALVFASGAFGLLFAWALPPRLAATGEEVIYERIPCLRRQILEAGDELAVRAATMTRSTAVSEFYLEKLRPFLESSRPRFAALIGAKGWGDTLIREVGRSAPYMTAAERELLDELSKLILRKSNLDVHDAGQSLLKSWLFFHIPATYSLLLVALLHAFIAVSFSGGPG
jgi:hypothetical protein